MHSKCCVGPLTEAALSTTTKNKPAWQGLILGVGVNFSYKYILIRVKMNIPYADGYSLVMALEVLEVKSVVLPEKEQLRDVPCLRSLSNMFLQTLCCDDLAFHKEILQRAFSSRNSQLA